MLKCLICKNNINRNDKYCCYCGNEINNKYIDDDIVNYMINVMKKNYGKKSLTIKESKKYSKLLNVNLILLAYNWEEALNVIENKKQEQGFYSLNNPYDFAKSKLIENPNLKISIIKELRERFNLGLVEAKQIVDTVEKM